MDRRSFGRTDLSVSRIAFGGVEIGIPYGIGVRGQEDLLSPDQAVTLLHDAVDRGVNFFDTAPAYGRSEELMGRALHDRRDRVVLCTKTPHLRDASGKLPPAGEVRRTLEETLHQSLQRLRTDRVDVLLMHQADEEILAREEILATLEGFKSAGKALALGVSTYGREDTRRVIEADFWDAAQVAVHLMDQRIADLLAGAEAAGTGIMVRSVLFKGILTDRGRQLHPQLEPVAAHRRKYLDLLEPWGIESLSELATRFVLSLEGVSSVLVGIDRREYLDAAVEVARRGPLPAELMRTLRGLDLPDPDFIDLPRWDREGWLT